MNDNLKPSGACRSLVRLFEGCRLTAYLCPAGVPTIGVGHTHGVRLGDRCTVQQADVWLSQDLEAAAAGVTSLVKVPLTQGQFDALTSFVFNFGTKKFAESTMLVLLNKGSYPAAAAQLPLWVHANGRVEDGLVRRRHAEWLMFLTNGVTS